MSTGTNLTPKEKQNRYRRRLRRKGLQPVQIWVPDTRAEGFAGKCRRQARLAARSAQEKPASRSVSYLRYKSRPRSSSEITASRYHVVNRYDVGIWG